LRAATVAARHALGVGRPGSGPGRGWWRFCRQAAQDGPDYSLYFAVDGVGAVQADEAVGQQNGQPVHALATLLAIYTGFARASHGLMIIRDELAKLDAS